jgi:hypothetical protein
MTSTHVLVCVLGFAPVCVQGTNMDKGADVRNPRYLPPSGLKLDARPTSLAGPGCAAPLTAWSAGL